MMKWEEITFKKSAGKEKVICPNCNHKRTDKKDKSLSIDHNIGAFNCHYCHEKGYRDQKERNEKTAKSFDIPKQLDNITALSEGMVKWFRERKITQKTLLDCKISEEQYNGSGRNLIVFNYFSGSLLVNKKYRTRDKKYLQLTNAKKIFYGLNDIMFETECYIVEGEMDKLALWEIGVTNVISLPNGAGDMSVFELCEKELEHIEHFYIAVDMDAKGKEAEDKIVHRIGKHKCSRIKFQNKDANDDLIAGVLEQSLEEPHQYPIEGTYNVSELWDGMVDIWFNGFGNTIKVRGPFFTGFNNMFSMVEGQLTTITGAPGTTKSTFIEWYVMNLVQFNGMKASFISPEHLPISAHAGQLAYKWIGKPIREGAVGQCSVEELEMFKKWCVNKLWITSPPINVSPDWDWILQTFEQQIYRYGIKLFVIDAYNKIKQPDGSLFVIAQTLARLTMFCQQHGVNVMLVVHPTKLPKDLSGQVGDVSLYDIKGSGDFADQTHNALGFNKRPDNAVMIQALKLKLMHQGQAGKEQLYTLDEETYRHVEFGAPVRAKRLDEY